ncbi:MAG: HPr(Ser) kinase/phosphatase [Kiritimatiellia bacterium]
METPDQSYHSRLPSISVRRLLELIRSRIDVVPVAGTKGLDRLIAEPMLHRPGLALTGFFEYFANSRIQVIGMTEYAYLASLSREERRDKLRRFLEADVPCIIFCRSKPPFAEMLELANEYQVPVFSTEWGARQLTHDGSFIIQEYIAPQIRLHGTMVEVAGVGVLIEGEAGLGKSETGLGLIKRGHALVADDLTQLRLDASGRIVASSLPSTRFFMEIRGIGIINVPQVFGISAVRGQKELNFVVTLRKAEEVRDLDRTGMADLHRELLGRQVPQIIIPVSAGRDLVTLVETAAQDFKLRQNGYFASVELDRQIMNYHMTLAGIPAGTSEERKNEG